MLLPQQIQAILYHLMMGWVYGCTFSFLCSFTAYMRFQLGKGLLEILYHVFFIVLSFYGLYQINGGATNYYLIIFFLVGIIVYYQWYCPVFIGVFAWFRHLFRPFRTKFVLVKKKILGIIKVSQKRLMKRRAHGRRKEKSDSLEEKEAISSSEKVL